MKALRLFTTAAFVAALFSVMSLSPPESTTTSATKVTICHHGIKTLSVGAGGVPAHLRHGDTLGVCP